MTATALRVLIVDDEAPARERLQDLLGDIADTQPTRIAGLAASGVEALAVLEREPVDLVLTDIRMPNASGIHLAALFREQFPLVRVLVLSMHEDPEYVRRAVALGARGYVLKDAPAQHLIEAIETVYRGGRYFSAGIEHLLDSTPPEPRPQRTLTPREASVLQWVSEGRSNKEIAALMGTSVRTVETHRLHLRRKLRIEGQAELIRYAVEHCRTAG